MRPRGGAAPATATSTPRRRSSHPLHRWSAYSRGRSCRRVTRHKRDSITHPAIATATAQHRSSTRTYCRERLVGPVALIETISAVEGKFIDPMEAAGVQRVLSICSVQLHMDFLSAELSVHQHGFFCGKAIRKISLPLRIVAPGEL